LRSRATFGASTSILHTSSESLRFDAILLILRSGPESGCGLIEAARTPAIGAGFDAGMSAAGTIPGNNIRPRAFLEPEAERAPLFGTGARARAALADGAVFRHSWSRGSKERPCRYH
jgi:hypothetical protein